MTAGFFILFILDLLNIIVYNNIIMNFINYFVGKEDN